MSKGRLLGSTTLVATLILLGAWLSLAGARQAASAVANKAVAATNIETLQPSSATNIGSLTSKAVPVAESPNSPTYVHIDKAHAVVKPTVPAGDNGALLRADLSAPGTILYVTYDCHGSTCPWTYQCAASTCSGHSIPFEYHGNNTATWWAWTNDGNNSEYVFAVHFH